MRPKSDSDVAYHSKVSIVLWRAVSMIFAAMALFLLSPRSLDTFADVTSQPSTSLWSLQLLTIPFFRAVAVIFLLFLAWVFWSFPRDGKPRIKGPWYWG